ncbi:MAG: hypothetical protein ACI82H_001722 [Alphaproteobacteria bacterium]|jgi:hypothetical protein
MTTSVDLEELRAKARAANVSDKTFLATDYLNHFNEAMMLLELVPDMPECIEDLTDWQPVSYEGHFQRSGFAGKDVAIEAYTHAPDMYRKPFDEIIRQLNELILVAIKGASAMIHRDRIDDASVIISFAMPEIKRLQGNAGAIINGAEVTIQLRDEVVANAENTLDQAKIDSLMNG